MSSWCDAPSRYCVEMEENSERGLILRAMVRAQVDSSGATIIRAEACHPHNPKVLSITADNSEDWPWDLHATWEYCRNIQYTFPIIPGQLPALFIMGLAEPKRYAHHLKGLFLREING